MAHNNVVTWTCDRCRRKVEIDTKRATGEPTPPAGWVLVNAESLDSTQAEREWEICGGCYSQVERLLMNQLEPETVGTPLPLQ